jgi:predicted regulator of amino acid metabolism with ACT domain
MWNNIMEKFEKYPSQQKVVKKLLELGLRIDTNNKIYCKDVEINISSLAKSLNTDRRVITSTIKNILKDEELKKIFMNIYPSGPVLTNISNVLGLGVIEIEGLGQKAGILYKIAKILAEENISIRQAYASDPEIDPIPHITIITDKQLEGDLIQLLLKIDGVSKVSLY